MSYNFLRLFLVSTERLPILEQAGTLPRRVTRQEYLKQLFSQRIDFEHRNKAFVYVPIGSEAFEDGPVLLGRIGRTVTAVENEPPEAGFVETSRTSWRAANFLIDTRDHADGQKIAIQYRQDVGKPISIASSLIAHLNETNRDSGWALEVNPLIDKSTFWEAVRRHQGEITAVTFHFVTPNILRMRTQLNEDLREAKQRHNARSVTQQLENPDGDLNLDGQDVEDSVDYVSEGGGSVKLRAGRRTVYNSENEQKVREVEDDEPLAVNKPTTWRRLAGALFS